MNANNPKLSIRMTLKNILNYDKYNQGAFFYTLLVSLTPSISLSDWSKTRELPYLPKYTFFPVWSVYNIFVAKSSLFILFKHKNIFTFIHWLNQIRLYLMLLSITTLLKFQNETQSIEIKLIVAKKEVSMSIPKIEIWYLINVL